MPGCGERGCLLGLHFLNKVGPGRKKRMLSDISTLLSITDHLVIAKADELMPWASITMATVHDLCS